MPDVTDIINSAINDAGIGDSSDGATSEPLAPVESAPATEAVSPSSGAAPAEGTPVDPPVDLDIDEELAQIATRRDARIPQQRWSQMAAKIRKKLTDAHQQELKTRDDRLAEATTRFEQEQQLASSNPAQFLQTVIQRNPAIQEYLRQQAAAFTTAQKPTVAATPPTDDPMPGPDLPDGYSLEGLKKRDDWVARQVEKRVIDKVTSDQEKRFGPIEKEWQARKTQEAIAPRVRQQHATLHQVWGTSLLKAHEAEIVSALKANPSTPADQVVARVLVPKIQAQREAIRQDIVREMQARPAAATRSAPAASTANGHATGERSAEDIVRSAFARHA